MVRGWLKAQRRPCWICVAFGKSGYIDYTLPAGHPYAFECDELVPVSKGGSPFSRSNVDAAHRCCNQWRGNKSVEEVLRLAAASSVPSTISVARKKGDEPTPVRSVEGVTSHLSE